MEQISITVARSAGGEGYRQEYTVPMPVKGLSVMGALDWIHQNVDPTLAYFSHAACYQGSCGRCLVRVNGKTVLACNAEITGNALLLEPWNDKVIRDLVCEKPTDG